MKIKFKCDDFITNDIHSGVTIYGFTFQVLSQDMTIRKKKIGEVDINYDAWPYVVSLSEHKRIFLRGNEYEDQKFNISACLFKTKEEREENKRLLIYTLKKWAE